MDEKNKDKTDLNVVVQNILKSYNKKILFNKLNELIFKNYENKNIEKVLYK